MNQHQIQRESAASRLGGAVKRFWPGPWGFLGAVTLVLAASMAYIGPRQFLMQILIQITEDTAYAPGYSERAFRRIEIGDTEQSVLATLGSPLNQRKTTPYVTWLYAPAPAPEFEAEGSYGGLECSYTSIRFGEDGTLDHVSGQIHHGTTKSQTNVLSTVSIFGDGVNSLGLRNVEIEELKAAKATPELIEAKFGKPRAIFDSRAVKWLHYSHSPGSKNYRQRRIGMDGNGKVCRIVSKIYWD